jgi:hypothetical protein
MDGLKFQVLRKSFAPTPSQEILMTTSDTSPQPQEARESTFNSNLKEGHQRFLAYAIEHSFVCGRRTPQDFIRHFPPSAIMKGLEHQPPLRASILVLTTGIKQKIALKKEWEDAAADLQIALEENETDPESIVALFASDDRVRYLDPQRIWGFLTEGEFWKPTSNKALSDLVRNHIAFLLERALEDKLLTHRDLVEGATVEEIANRLPKTELGRLIQCALQNADKGTSFTEVDLLATTPPRTLVQHVPLAHLWDMIVVPRIADRHGYVAAPKSLVVELPKAPAPELQKVTAPELPPPPVVKEAASLKPVTHPTQKDLAPPKDMSKMKSRTPEPPVVKPPEPAAPADIGPSLHKAVPSPFGDESDDIEVIEDDVQAV